MTKVPGSCLCGAVRFEVELPALACGHCWCRYCQAATGAAFWSWVMFPARAVRWTHGRDRIGSFVHPQAGSTRTFCNGCGSVLSWQRQPDEIDLSLVLLHGDAGMRPTKHLFADRAPAWQPLPADGLPRFGGSDGCQPLQAGPRESRE